MPRIATVTSKVGKQTEKEALVASPAQTMSDEVLLPVRVTPLQNRPGRRQAMERVLLPVRTTLLQNPWRMRILTLRVLLPVRATLLQNDGTPQT